MPIYGISTDIAEFIRSAPVAVHITIDPNEMERNERPKHDSDTEIYDRTTETDLNGPTYTAEG